MSKKILTTLFLMIGLALGFWLSSIQVAAQGPSNVYPGGAVYVDNQWHTVPGTTSLWYVIDYSGDNTQIEIVLANATLNKLDFSFFTPDQIQLPDKFADNPIGRGSSQNVTCQDGSGKCLSDHKTWNGKFFISGKFYIRVINDNPDAKPFFLGVSGSAVSVQLPTPTPVTPTLTFTPVRATPTISATTNAAPNAILTSLAQVAATLKASGGNETAATQVPTATPTVTSTPTVTPTVGLNLNPDNLYPQNAAWVVSDGLKFIPERSELWFKFDYDAFESMNLGEKRVITILIPDGAIVPLNYPNHLDFELYTPEQLRRYLANDLTTFERLKAFIGESSLPNVQCKDGPGKCVGGDLLWSGSFPLSGTYYIRVINDNPKGTNFRLLVTGKGVVLWR